MRKIMLEKLIYIRVRNGKKIFLSLKVVLPWSFTGFCRHLVNNDHILQEMLFANCTFTVMLYRRLSPSGQ